MANNLTKRQNGVRFRVTSNKLYSFKMLVNQRKFLKLIIRIYEVFSFFLLLIFKYYVKRYD